MPDEIIGPTIVPEDASVLKKAMDTNALITITLSYTEQFSQLSQLLRQ